MMVCVLIRPELLKEHKTGSFMRSHPKHWSRIIQSYTIPLTHIKWEGEEVRKLVLLQVTNSSYHPYLIYLMHISILYLRNKTWDTNEKKDNFSFPIVAKRIRKWYFQFLFSKNLIDGWICNNTFIKSKLHLWLDRYIHNMQEMQTRAFRIHIIRINVYEFLLPHYITPHE